MAEEDGVIVGTYYMRPNEAGGGKHVCNCGYMTRGHATGRGVARQMCLHSLDHARKRGYRAMQFNFVVSTNARAVRLWQLTGLRDRWRSASRLQSPDARLRGCARYVQTTLAAAFRPAVPTGDEAGTRAVAW